MPGAMVADGAPDAQPSPGGDTPSLSSLDTSDLISRLWCPQFPRADLVDVAAGMLPGIPGGQGAEGPSWRVLVSPGTIAVTSRDEARYERTLNRALDDRRHVVDALTAFLVEDGEFPEDPAPSREITGWSAKSRSNMVRALAELDYGPMLEDRARLLAMLTLTYPRCWLRVAPNGRAVKKHLKALRKRYARAYGEPFLAVWKLEFQARRPDARCGCGDCAGRDDGRAPHVHLLIRPPHQLVDGQQFRQWISATWADIVDHPDPEQRELHHRAGTGLDWNQGLRSTDPRRLAVYFTKHGSFKAKEYQHCVPEQWREPGEGPGRFWGYWGLARKVSGAVVTERDAVRTARTLRRWAHAQQTTREVTRPRVRGGAVQSRYPEVIGLAGAQLVESRTTRYRRSRTRVRRLGAGRGWVSVNDAPAFASTLALYLVQHREDVHRDEDQAQLVDYASPLARARRLPPGPRRDALIERLAHLWTEHQ